MKQTAVEWLFDQFFKVKWDSMQGNRPTIFEQAKEIEKQQIMDAYWDGGQDIPTSLKTCKWYYNETFNTKEK
jgi:hypothetical protein